MEPTPRPKSRWRFLRWLLITVAALATLIAIFYTEEDIRGKMAWDNYCHTLETQGEKLSWQEVIPPAVPDDQNFFAAPFFQPKGGNTMSAYGKSPAFPDMGYWAEGRMTDLAKWQAYYRRSPNEFPIAAQVQTPAADVLLALSKNDSALEELRQITTRPYSNIPLNYENLFGGDSDLLNYLTTLKRCSVVLELRASAELANGQSDQALADVKLLFRLADSLRGQPLLISQLVRIAILHITLQPIWTGTINHQWTDGQLAEITDELAKLDFLMDYQYAVRGERIFALQSFENQRITHKYEFVDDKGQTNTTSYTYMPAAFFYQNELAVARVDQELALPLVDTNAHTVSPKKLQSANHYVQKQIRPFSYSIMGWSTFYTMGFSVRRFAFAQVGVDLAQVACALERYHLTHGEYPETLDALTPQYLSNIPNDVIDGKPLHYRRTPDGKYLLYSVGWNEKDDGGQPGLTKQGSLDITKGDWIWPVTAK